MVLLLSYILYVVAVDAISGVGVGVGVGAGVDVIICFRVLCWS